MRPPESSSALVDRPPPGPGVTAAVGKAAPDPDDKHPVTGGYAVYATAGGLVIPPMRTPALSVSGTGVREIKTGQFTLDANLTVIGAGKGSTASGVQLSGSVTGGLAVSAQYQLKGPGQQDTVSAEGYGYVFGGPGQDTPTTAGPGVLGSKVGGGLSYSHVLPGRYNQPEAIVSVTVGVVREETNVAPSGGSPGFTTVNTTGFLNLTFARTTPLF